MTEDFLKHPNLAILQKFLPCEFTWKEADLGSHLSMFQVNVFDCGGIAIGVFICHMIADVGAISTFLRSWAAIASGSETEFHFPSFIFSSLYPQNDTMLEKTTMVNSSPFFKEGKCVTRRFMFDPESLATLKAKAGNSRMIGLLGCADRCHVEVPVRHTNFSPRKGYIPTCVQSVNALIWKAFISTRTTLSVTQKPSFVGHEVDLRRRASPPFSESCMGNFLWPALTQCKDGCGTELHRLVGEIKKEINRVDAKFISELEGESGFIKYCETLKGIKQEQVKEADFLAFTSWCNLGLYTVDFGWGKRAWATRINSSPDSDSVFMNIVTLLETKDGNGMEAWVCLDEQDMAIFECNSELLSFASVHHDGHKLG